MRNFSKLLPYAILLVVVTTMLLPLFLLKQAFFGEEQIGFYYALSYFVDQALLQGHGTAWISGYYGGASGSMQQFLGAYFPSHILIFSIFDLFTAQHLAVLLGIYLGLAATFHFGRMLGWGIPASLMMAFGYMTATSFSWLMIGTTAAYSFAALPVLLVGVEYVRQTRTLLGVLIGSLGIAIGFLGGFAQIMFYAYCVAGAYVLFSDYQRLDKSATPLKWFTVSYAFIAMTILGLTLSSPQFFASANLIDYTIRTSSYAAENAGVAYPTEFVALLMPPFLDIPYINGGHSAGMYVGGVGLVAALLGLWVYGSSVAYFFAGLYVFIFALAFRFPILSWLNDHIPPFSHMGGQYRWSVIASFPVAFLAGYGMHKLLSNPEAIRPALRKRVLWAIALIPLLIVLGVAAVQVITAYVSANDQLLENLLTWYAGGRTLAHPIAYYKPLMLDALTKLSEIFSLSHPRFLAGFLIWIFTLCGMYLFFYGKARLRNVTMTTVIVVTVLLSTIPQWDEFVSQDVYTHEPKIVSFFKEQGLAQHEYRVFGYLLGDGLFYQLKSQSALTHEEVMQVQHEALVNNTNLYWDIDRMDGMEPYRFLRHNRLLNSVIVHDFLVWDFNPASRAIESSSMNKLHNRDVQMQVTKEEKLAAFHRNVPLLEMMNVHFVFSPFELPEVGMKKVKDVEMALTGKHVVLHVYKTNTPLARVHIAKRQQFVEGERNALLAVLENKDFGESSVIECAACNAAFGSGEVTIDEYVNGKIRFIVESENGAWVVISESAIPGWRAKIDGKSTQLYRANYLFQAIFVPAGSRKVEMEYVQPAVFERGLAFETM